MKTPILPINVKLTNIEFICLKMASHPGYPARWYLRALHQYRRGTPGTGSWNAIYFNPSGKYRNVLFTNSAPEDRAKISWQGGKFQSSCGSFTLTPAGHTVARRAATKIGL